jgi:cellulose synthase/poly-beta-1,6-N-acetylglucosamine synthase-like glycosyltransferase
MLLNFNLYDLFVLSFVQLLVSTALVLSPARELGSRYRWTGSRVTEVLVGSLGSVGITAVSCVLTQLLWGLPVSSLETAAYPLVLVSVVVIALQPDRNLVGQVFYASFASASVAFIGWAAYIAVIASDSILETVTASFVLLLDAAALLVWMSNINYQSDVLCRARRGRPLPRADPSYQPMVSLHIPAYNEPPELLIETIKAVERLDYPDFEIVVMDNNTKDPAVWGPVEEYCRDRPRVKFVHVDPWPGYKAGACNLALRQYTDPRAEIVGLVDADDLVQPYYLRETISYFSDPTLGFVQTFEGNREFEGSAYYTACVDSYQAFYLSNMSSRNERDAVPFVGTMGLFRRSALEDIGGWNEWCICEDTEASLRVAKDGWSGLYIPRCFGRGIVPPSFAGMLTQRHRWCFGAMQILRLHWRSLMPWDRAPDNHLTPAQRRDYLMASLSWFRDLVMLAFSLLLLVVTGLLVAQSDFAVAPLDGERSLLPLSFILIATIAMFSTLLNWTTLSYRRALMSLVISLSVTWIIARGCIEGVARRDGVFLRTSKASGSRTVLAALLLTKWETALAVALFVCAGMLAAVRHGPWLLIGLIVVQATIYLCGPIAAVWNLAAQAGSEEAYRRRFAARRERAQRRRRAAWAPFPRPAAAALTAVCVGGIASAFVAPVSLLHANRSQRPAASAQAAARPDVYLNLGSSYHAVKSVDLSNLTLSFNTSSFALLGELLRVAADGGRIPHVGVAVRGERAQTFGTAAVASMRERLSGRPGASVSLLLSQRSPSIGAAGRLPRGRAASAAKARVTVGSRSYAVTAVTLSQKAGDASLKLTFTTSAVPLLRRVVAARGARIPALTLSVRDTAGPGLLRHRFSGLRVSSVATRRSGSLSGTATLVVR